jgi:hypothetical protein
MVNTDHGRRTDVCWLYQGCARVHAPSRLSSTAKHDGPSARRRPRWGRFFGADSKKLPARNELALMKRGTIPSLSRDDGRSPVELIGDDFTIVGPLRSRMPTEGPIERILIVGASPEEVRSLKLPDFKPKEDEIGLLLLGTLLAGSNQVEVAEHRKFGRSRFDFSTPSRDFARSRSSVG